LGQILDHPSDYRFFYETINYKPHPQEVGKRASEMAELMKKARAAHAGLTSAVFDLSGQRIPRLGVDFAAYAAPTRCGTSRFADARAG